MPMAGGPADKVGNRYERRWAVRAMLDVIAGVAESLRIEVPGEEGAGAEFRLIVGGTPYWYQSKRQRDTGAWTIAAMANEGFLQAWLPKLQAGGHCVFASGTSADELRELCERARDAQTWAEYDEHFLVAEQQRTRFTRLRNLWVGIDDEHVFKNLRRVDVQTMDERNLAELVRIRLGGLVDGHPDTVNDILGQFADDQIHRELEAADLWRHLEGRGIHPTARAAPTARRSGGLPIAATAPSTQAAADEQQLRDRLDQLPPLTHSRLEASWHDDQARTWRLVTTLTSMDALPRDVVDEWQDAAPQWLIDAPWQVQIAAGELATAYGARRLAGDLFVRAAREGVPRRHRWLARAALLFDNIDDPGRRDAALTANGRCADSTDPLARAVAALFEGDLAGASAHLQEWVPDDPMEQAVRSGFALRLAVGDPEEPFSVASLEAALEVTGRALDQQWTSGLAIARARMLMYRARLGDSPALYRDLQQARDLAVRARDERRAWRGDSAEPTALACQAAVLSIDLVGAIRLGTPGEDGATAAEANTPEVREYVAVAASQLGDLSLARASAEHLTDPFARARVDALLAEASGTDSVPHWRQAVALAGDNDERLAQALTGYAMAAQSQDVPGLDQFAARYPEAGEQIRAMAELSAGNPGAAINRLRGQRRTSITAALSLAQAYRTSGQIDRCVTTLLEAAGDFHDPSLRYSAATTLAEAGRTIEAEQELQSLLAVTADDWPGRADAVRSAAQLAYGRHDLHRATELLQTLMRLAPTDESSRWALVHILMRRSDLAAAWRTLTTAPHPLEARNVGEAQMWIELHRRFGPADETVNGSIALLRRFGTSEQFSAYVLTSLLAPGSSRDPLPPAVLADFHRAIDAFFQQWPDSPYLRRISTDDTTELLARLTEMVTPSEEELVRRRRLTRDLMIGRLPLGILTQAIKRSYTEIIVRRGVGIIPALHPDQREFTASMAAVRRAIDKDVAIGIDAVAVFATLPADVQELAARSFSRLVTTDDVLRDVRNGHDSLTQRTTATWFYDVHARSGRMAEVSEAEADRLARQSAQLLAMIQGLTRYPRPACRAVLDTDEPAFAGWMSVIDLALDQQIPIWTDDHVLRSIARQVGLSALSTPALLAYLFEQSVLTSDRHEDAVRSMIKARVGDFPVNGQRLMELAEDEEWAPVSVAVVLSRPAAWTNRSRTVTLFADLLQSSRPYRPMDAPDWLYAAIVGATLAAADPFTATDIAARLLALALENTAAQGALASKLVTAARRALADSDDVDQHASDPLPLSATLLRNAYSIALPPSIATSYVLASLSELSDTDRQTVLRALLQ
ncbi:PIN domain-containing protein [Lentzea sp. NEAU-D7]|uniref:PIN domain-containing protein n=1 Tax=Lentzea sp. NEAU-D7 TaxID=2994667 RepID=UPI00224A53A4|nr:hypothetical protein [Lentzea sp. NEAU-D7]MCX2950200.1 hypothetical protein [Lentzea sp. NEAU-D7]